MEDIELQAASHVGQLIFSFARLDFLLTLALRNLLSTTNPNSIAPVVERLGFKAKLDALREVVPVVLSGKPEAMAEFDAWYPGADRLRATRNAFVHGRWGLESRESLFNAATGVGKSLAGVATVFSMADLSREVAAATKVLNEFHEWHLNHVVRVA